MRARAAGAFALAASTSAALRRQEVGAARASGHSAARPRGVQQAQARVQRRRDGGGGDDDGAAGAGAFARDALGVHQLLRVRFREGRWATARRRDDAGRRPAGTLSEGRGRCGSGGSSSSAGGGGEREGGRTMTRRSGTVQRERGRAASRTITSYRIHIRPAMCSFVVAMAARVLVDVDYAQIHQCSSHSSVALVDGRGRSRPREARGCSTSPPPS